MVSGILGIDFDRLLRREEAANRRRRLLRDSLWAGYTATVTIGAISIGYYALYLEKARS